MAKSGTSTTTNKRPAPSTTTSHKKKTKTTPPPNSTSTSTSASKPSSSTTNTSTTTTPNSRINSAQASRAITALLTHHQNHLAKKAASKGHKQDLLASESGEFILIQLALAKIPERVSPKPVALRLPHAIYSAEKDDHSICLIVKEADKGKIKKALEGLKLEGVTEVVGLQELRTDYKEFQERRKLRDAFDLFLVDDRILPLLGKALGKIFFSKKKQPAPLKLQGLLTTNTDAHTTVGKRILASRQKTYLFKSHGNSLTIKVARTTHTHTQILENVLVGVEAAVGALPGKWKNVMCVSVKTGGSVALPIYQRLPQYLVAERKHLELKGGEGVVEEEEEGGEKKKESKGEGKGKVVVAEKKGGGKKEGKGKKGEKKKEEGRAHVVVAPAVTAAATATKKRAREGEEKTEKKADKKGEKKASVPVPVPVAVAPAAAAVAAPGTGSKKRKNKGGETAAAAAGAAPAVKAKKTKGSK